MAGEFVIEHKSNYITADVKEAGHEMDEWLLEHGGEETGRKEWQYSELDSDIIIPKSVYHKACIVHLFPFAP